MPLISVVVPCYNAGPYLRACLASLCAQTLRDLEITVIDDGSTDGSGALLDELAAGDARIRALHQPNAGVSAARNAGLEASHGDYVAFVDADDTLPPDAFALLYARIAANPSLDIVSSLYDESFSDGTVRTLFPTRRCDRREQVLSLLIEGDGIYNSMCDKLYRRELLMRWNIRALPGLRIGEDGLFNLEAYARAEHVEHLPVVTYVYRIHGASAMRSFDRAQHFLRHLPWLEGIRAVLGRLDLREAYFRDYCFSRTLRLYKERGLGGVLRDFRQDVRPAVLEGIDRRKLRAGSLPLYAAVRCGVFPLWYCLSITARRGRDFVGRIVRYGPTALRKRIARLRPGA